MGMFDEYRPKNAVCPKCGTELRHWQGKDGVNALLVWEEEKRSAVDQLVDEDCANGRNREVSVA